MADCQQRPVTIGEPRPHELIKREVRPEVAKIRVVDLKDALGPAFTKTGLMDGVQEDFFHRVSWANLFEGDQSAGQFGSAIGKQVSPVEDTDLFRVFPFEAVDRLVDFTYLRDPDPFTEVGE